MTDPERISKRSLGLAAQLLQAGADEQPREAGIQRTLAALGVSAALVTTTSTAGAVAGTVKATGAAGGGVGLGTTAAGGAVKAVSATLLVKWIGIGVVGGIGLAGAAAVATSAAAPSVSVSPKVVSVPHPPAASALAAPEAARPGVVAQPPPAESAPAPAPAIAAPRASSETALSAPVLEVGAPLAAEVAYVDRARALLSSGQADQGLALLQSYEREFPEARLLPEVLFLRLETCDRLGRKTEASAAAQRLVDGFPKSPHASRARNLLAR